MIPYLLHSSILLTGCFIFYWLFIRKETFFKLNRWVLISGIFLSVTIPLIQIPENWSLKKTQISQMIAEVPPMEDQSNRANSTEEIIPTLSKNETSYTAGNGHVIADSSEIESSESFFDNFISFSTILWYVYLAGVIIFFLAFLLQLVILLTKMYSYVSFQDGRYRIVELVKDEAPYSFWNSIFINPTKYDLETYTQILNHEKIHIKQAHFFDKVISELLLIAFWFNPFVWFYRNAITNNLEYLTDSSMLNEGVEKQSYQLSLLKVSVPQHPLNLSTNYNNSFLKNRIAMMNSKKSSARSSWKYMFLIPLIGFSMISMNETISNDIDLTSNFDGNNLTTQDSIPKDNKTSTTTTSSTTTSSTIISSHPQSSTATNSISDGTVITTKPLTSTSTQTTSSTSSVDNGPAITTVTKTSVYAENDSEILEHLNTFNLSQDLKSKHWTAEIDGNRVCFQLNNSHPEENWTWMTSECFKTSELSEIPRGSDKDFYIKRAAGQIDFNGSFSDDFGDGTFNFKANESFDAYLKSQGFEINNKEKFLHLFMNNVDKDYISFLKSQKLNADGKDLVELSVHGVDKEKIKGFVQIFNDLDYKGYQVRDLIQFQIHDVNPEYVNEIRAQGMTDLSVQQVVQAKIHDVEPSFIKEVKEYGFEDISLNDIIQFSIHDVDVEYIQKMKNLGFRNLTHSEIVQSSIHDVDPEYIAAIHDAGFTNMKMNDLVQFAIHDIDAEYIKSFEEAGLKNLSYNEIIQAGIHDVDVDFIKELKGYGMGNLDMNEIVQMAIHDVDADYMQEMKALGFRDLSHNEIIQAKIHDIEPAYIKGLQEQGLGDMEINDIVQFAIHDIDVRDIKAYKNAGFEMDNQEIIQAGIHDVSPKYIQAMRDLGFTETDINSFVNAKIHGVNPSFIKKARSKGHDLKTLGEYIKLKNRGMQ